MASSPLGYAYLHITHNACTGTVAVACEAVACVDDPC